MTDEPKTKRCPHCAKTKKIDEFPLARGRAGGRGSWCKRCHADRKTASRTTVQKDRAGRYATAYAQALGALRDAHKDEFQTLLVHFKKLADV